MYAYIFYTECFCISNIFTDLLNIESIYQFYERYSMTTVPSLSHEFNTKLEDLMFSVCVCLFPWK